MAGYSGTPLPKKLGIREGSVVALVGAPAGFDATLGELPASVSVRRNAKGTAPLDVVMFFARARRELEDRLGTLAGRLHPAGGLWVAWPKKASGVVTDVTEDVVRALALATGLVDNKVCAIDDVWSGLRLVFRVKDRPARATGKAARFKSAVKKTTAARKKR